MEQSKQIFERTKTTEAQNYFVHRIVYHNSLFFVSRTVLTN
jgi:hypothetical protein